MDCSPPGSSVLGILQTRILEWDPVPRGSSIPRDETWVFCISYTAGGFLTHWATREALLEDRVALFNSKNFFFFSRPREKNFDSNLVCNFREFEEFWGWARRKIWPKHGSVCPVFAWTPLGQVCIQGGEKGEVNCSEMGCRRSGYSAAGWEFSGSESSKGQ